MVGIDAIAFHLPLHYLDLQELAAKRDIPYEKLAHGLGVLRSAVPHPDEDAVSMAANAALRLILENGTDPSRIGRIYVGTESSVDGAKPIASYVVGLLEEFFEKMYGPGCFRHCDAVDMTFACIGATDALQNTLDWCALREDRIGMVIATDYAKYELGSSGEYTQGAGAIAMLVAHKPRLLAIDSARIAAACKDEHDFYKPVRKVAKRSLLETLAGEGNVSAGAAPETVSAGEWFTAGEQLVAIHKSTPLFDGQFSNQCYAQRLKEAYGRYLELGGQSLRQWARAAFHLPYAYHGKRIFPELYLQEFRTDAALRSELDNLQPGWEELEPEAQVRLVAKSPAYQAYARRVIDPGSKASSEIGNLYTASIFLSLISLLDAAYQAGEELTGATIGCCAYGSGSKAKVFDAVVQAGWKDQAASWRLTENLEKRKAIGFAEYEQLHNGHHLPLETPPGFYLSTVEAGTYIRKYDYRFRQRQVVTTAAELSDSLA